MRHLRRRLLTGAAAMLLVSSAAVTEAVAPSLNIGTAAQASARAEAIFHLPDLVSVYETGAMSASLQTSAFAAAQQALAPATISRGFTIGLTAVRRGSTVVQQSRGAGWAFPLAVTALPLDVVGAVMGRDIATPLSQGQVVMGKTSADLRGAQAGDTVDLVAVNGSIQRFTIGLVAPDSRVGGTEILMSLPEADQLGATLTTSVLVYGQFDRDALESAMAARGLTTSTRIRVRRSWDAFDPDSTLGMARTKQLLGEFDYYYAGISTLGWTSMSPEWKAAYLPTVRESYPTGIRAICNFVIQPDLRAALAEVASTYPGLVAASGGSAFTGIDVGNTNSYGGCGTGQVRFARITQNLGSISRHSWAQPIDMSTAANCQGCTPKFDCRIVRIFRAHGFAWGGNFLTPDGMHFEWVGEPRDSYQYPSRFCPNLPAAPTQSLGSPPTQASTFFADDGWALQTDD
jgi:hypothetical protein